MSVLKDFRDLSTLEYYKNALRLRKALEEYLMNDFFRKVLCKSISRTINEFHPLDRKLMEETYMKYYDDRLFKMDTPKSYIDYERAYLIDLCREMTQNIVSANSIHVNKKSDNISIVTRKQYQNKAITACYKLLEELYEMQTMYPTDLNDLTNVIALTDKEYDLLTGWKRSDNNKLGKT